MTVPVRGRFADAMFLVCGLAALAVTALSVVRDDGAGPWIRLGMLLVAVALIGFGLVDHVPSRASWWARTVSLTSAAGFCLVLALACLLAPAQTLGSGTRLPRRWARPGSSAW